MGGIIILSFLFIGFVIYCVLIYLPIRWAKKRGISGRKRFYIGIISFLVVSALFFGKNLISYTAFRCYCKNEAGMTVYKTLEQWKQENPGVWETLEPVHGSIPYENREKYPDIPLERLFDNEIYQVGSDGNQRIILYKRTDYLFWGAVEKYSDIFFDNEKKEILATYKWYIWVNTWDTTPNKRGWRGRSYLGNKVCDLEREKFSAYRQSFSNHQLTQLEKQDEQ